MKHAEKIHNVWFAKMMVPEDVREALGRVKFKQTVQTGSEAEAAPRVALLVAGWK